ncbi:hypothetical protein PoB_006929500 [Plakobranchus ocellatus]|uniref:Uncharacterized protein n=1 Tax=Plakobranchus ocellatus TaxID=259542 RepID=A0AAV4DFB9_9GAST|nr:hypothetical protein PoB_006929500 [Plakobranchus ocellatus]
MVLLAFCHELAVDGAAVAAADNGDDDRDDDSGGGDWGGEGLGIITTTCAIEFISERDSEPRIQSFRFKAKLSLLFTSLKISILWFLFADGRANQRCKAPTDFKLSLLSTVLHKCRDCSETASSQDAPEAFKLSKAGSRARQGLCHAPSILESVFVTIPAAEKSRPSPGSGHDLS